MIQDLPEEDRDDDDLHDDSEPVPAIVEGMSPETPETTGAESSMSDEAAGIDEAEALTAAPDAELSDPQAESPPGDMGFEEAEDLATPMMADSAPGSSVGNSSRAAPPPNRPYFGPITRLAELPPYMTQHLDEKSAANLKAVLENPDQFDAEILDHTSIQGQYSAFPRTSGWDDYEAPWYHEPLPPLRLEVVLIKYDRIIEEVIDRAARKIDRDTDGKLNYRIDTLLFQLRSEMRNLLR